MYLEKVRVLHNCLIIFVCLTVLRFSERGPLT